MAGIPVTMDDFRYTRVTLDIAKLAKRFGLPETSTIAGVEPSDKLGNVDLIFKAETEADKTQALLGKMKKPIKMANGYITNVDGCRAAIRHHKWVFDLARQGKHICVKGTIRDVQIYINSVNQLSGVLDGV